MRTNHASKLLAATLVVAGIAGATSSAFADEYVTQQNKEQYAVSAGETTAQPYLPREAAPTSYNGGYYTGGPNAAPLVSAPAMSHPSYGPFSDQDPHSGPSQNG